MTFQELMAWRKRHGFTQSQAASVLGISVSEVANYERDENGNKGKPDTIPKAIQRACDSFDRKSELLSALRSKIKDGLRSDGPPGHITPEVLREILLEIVDAIQKEKLS
ncbi:helix-turn-helix domain-containing protein [Rhodopila sp.]|uniref:helix-turn-helix domain-containing protein n=1 Tax=Rhodopila sp. TaxID=2480087 RepID=UPI003D0D01A6